MRLTKSLSFQVSRLLVFENSRSFLITCRFLLRCQMLRKLMFRIPLSLQRPHTSRSVVSSLELFCRDWLLQVCSFLSSLFSEIFCYSLFLLILVYFTYFKTSSFAQLKDFLKMLFLDSSSAFTSLLNSPSLR